MKSTAVNPIQVGLVTALGAVLVPAGCVRAESPREAWADSRLPVTGGLVVWLDAARLPEARAALKFPPLKEGDPLDLWPDASGAKRHVTQRQAPARPAFLPTGDF